MPSQPNQTPTAPDAHPPHYLREWREFMGWSQEVLGEKAGVHHTKIGRIETGKRDLKTGFLRQLAEIFRVPASAILDVNPSTPEGRKTATMLQAWDRLTPGQRETVLQMVLGLAPPTPRDNVS